MNEHGVTVFSPHRDAEAAAAMVRHNTRMLGELGARLEALVTAAALHRAHAADGARRDLLAWCHDELLPHARAEERALYRPAGAEPQGDLVVESMLEDHETLFLLVGRLESAPDPVRAVAAASALQAVLDTHLRKENEQLLPMLADSPYVSLERAIEGLHELVGAEAGAVSAAELELEERTA